MKLLLLTMKWNYGRKDDGESFEYWNFVRPLRRLLKDDLTFFDYVEDVRQHGKKEMEAEVAKLVEEKQPDAILLVPFDDAHTPDFSVFQSLRAKFDRIKQYVWSCDSTWRYGELDRPWATVMDGVVSTSLAVRDWFVQDGIGDKYIRSQWAANVFDYPCHSQFGERDTDVAFCGSMHGGRIQYIEALQASGLRCWFGGMDSKRGRATHEEMVSGYNRSKIVLNFNASSRYGPPQVKARIFEAAACGACVVTESHPEIDECFGFNEIIQFGALAPADFVNYIRGLLAMPKHLASIAESGHKRVLESHTWEKRFGQLLEWIENPAKLEEHKKNTASVPMPQDIPAVRPPPPPVARKRYVPPPHVEPKAIPPTPPTPRETLVPHVTAALAIAAKELMTDGALTWHRVAHKTWTKDFIESAQIACADHREIPLLQSMCERPVWDEIVKILKFPSAMERLRLGIAAIAGVHTYEVYCNDPLVSYVVPYRNACTGVRQERWLVQCAESLLTQSYKRLEILFVNDGSTDGSEAALRRVVCNDSRAKLIGYSGGEHRGLTWVLNHGIASAKGAFIARLDSDDFALPDRTKLQADFLLDHADVAIVGGAMRIVNVQNGMEEVADPSARDDAGIRAAATERCPFYHPTVMFRRSVWQAIGGYPDGFRYCEDYPYWVEVLRWFKGANLPDVLTVYRRHKDGAAGSHFAEQQGCAARVKQIARETLGR